MKLDFNPIYEKWKKYKGWSHYFIIYYNAFLSKTKDNI